MLLLGHLTSMLGARKSTSTSWSTTGLVTLFEGTSCSWWQMFDVIRKRRKRQNKASGVVGSGMRMLRLMKSEHFLLCFWRDQILEVEILRVHVGEGEGGGRGYLI
jgi:hypothetical protein